MPQDREGLISVIMSVYNEEEGVLLEAAQSILGQTHQTLEFLILLDNPQNLAALRVLEGLRDRDGRVRLIVNGHNLGLTRSLNRGIAEASGRYIARMDADDVSYPTRLSDQLAFLEAHGLDLIGGQLEYITEEGRPIMTVDRLPLDDEAVRRKVRFNNVIAHPAYFGRREVFTGLGGYRDIPACEDYDFVLRALAGGFRLGNCDRVVLRYRMTENSISRKNGLRQYLTSRHLVRRYLLGSLLEDGLEEALELTLRKKVDARGEDAFSMAARDFNRGLRRLREKRYARGLHLMVKGTFTSPHYLKKLVLLLFLNL